MVLLRRVVVDRGQDRLLRGTIADVVLLLTTSPGAEFPKAARERWVRLAERALAFGQAAAPR
ncbi:hypothetical protein [Allokutzneria albata]|uniref:Uncharacterized protein n=1 Tax=Allokutzneria albata TaxID=211114 RepID=A0A1H0BP58_ALLAB|nr:hypothetical protein [Allokutzneria albata]SDN47404.1 hypothetical protein SAMN04489726_6768 [Allokutzneria albata]